MQDKLPTILVVDDTETNIDILVDLLSDNYDVMVSLDGQSALEIAHTEDIELILLDIMMPHIDGYETCRILKENPNTKEIPVIFITAKIDEDSIEEAYDIGGIDYVTKPFKPKELLARVKNQLKLKSLIANLEYMSSHDTMTGIYNRRKFFELSEYKFIHEKEDLYSIMIDIDNFKPINDSYGHPVGDKVIKLVVNTINGHISTNAIFGRLGGEEFAILSNFSSSEIAQQNVENMREAVENLELQVDNDKAIKFTISLGVVKINSYIETLDQFLKEADFTLYEAKGNGRNRSIFRS